MIDPTEELDEEEVVATFPFALKVGDYYVGVPNPSKTLVTKLCESPLHSYFDNLGYLVNRYVPTEWKSGDVFDQDVAKYRKDDEYTPVVEDFRSGLLEYFSDVLDSCSPCFDVETLCALIPRSSSSGIEYAKYGLTKGDILDDYETHPGSSGLDVALQWFHNGAYSFTYAAISPKDEVRDASKVKEGKIRSFLVMPFGHYVGSSMLYAGHHAAVSAKFADERRYGNKYDIYTSYGADRYHLDLDVPLSHFYEQECASGDAVKWDGSLLGSLMAVSCDLLWLMLLPRHRTFNNWVRHYNLTRILIATPYLYAGRLCFKKRGMPSGAWHTLIINTIYHIGVRLLSKRVYLHHNIKLVSIVLGDDNCLAGKYILDLEVEIYRLCGVVMEYEDGFSFLQCNLFRIQNHHVIIPNIDKIVCSLAWRSRNDLPSGMTDLQSAYIRCCAMRNIVWPHEEYRSVIGGAINYVCDRTVDGVPFCKTQAFKHVHANYLSDAQLQTLWFQNIRFN